MRKFILKIILLTIGGGIFSIILFSASRLYYDHLFLDQDAIFIWGDSQAYQGVDIVELSKIMDRNVYSAAHHGAGVYDLLTFSESVPKNSTVIISISKLVQVRYKERDYNKSGMSLWALKKLYDNNYSIAEIVAIFEDNIRPRGNIHSQTHLYPYNDSIQLVLPFSRFKTYYEEIPDFINDKQNAYLEGVKNLISKNCDITFVEFPIHPDLVEVIKQYPLHLKTEELKLKIEPLFGEFYTDSIILMKSKNIFRDLTHLNCVGAKDFTSKLGQKLKKQARTTMYIGY